MIIKDYKISLQKNNWKKNFLAITKKNAGQSSNKIKIPKQSLR